MLKCSESRVQRDALCRGQGWFGIGRSACSAGLPSSGSITGSPRRANRSLMMALECCADRASAAYTAEYGVSWKVWGGLGWSTRGAGSRAQRLAHSMQQRHCGMVEIQAVRARSLGDHLCGSSGRQRWLVVSVKCCVITGGTSFKLADPRCSQGPTQLPIPPAPSSPTRSAGGTPDTSTTIPCRALCHSGLCLPRPLHPPTHRRHHAARSQEAHAPGAVGG